MTLYNKNTCKKGRFILKKRITLLISIAALLSILSGVLTLYREEVSSLYGYSKSRSTLSSYGSTGQEVKNIQYKLSKWGYYSGKIDGIYGYKTYKAVRLFQYKNGLSVDGVSGAETLSALGLPTGKSNNTDSTINVSKEASLLAHLIHGEARGEPYIGQVAVGAVVLNRTRNGSFPKTIAGVIYQPGAFDAVADGQINLAPNETSFKAARDALAGWDPSDGCIYYFNPATATSKWIWSRTIVKKIGKHNFAK